MESILHKQKFCLTPHTQSVPENSPSQTTVLEFIAYDRNSIVIKNLNACLFIVDTTNMSKDGNIKHLKLKISQFNVLL